MARPTRLRRTLQEEGVPGLGDEVAAPDGKCVKRQKCSLPEARCPSIAREESRSREPESGHAPRVAEPEAAPCNEEAAGDESFEKKEKDEVDSENESDFDSSDIDGAFMSLGYADMSEAGKVQAKWSARHRNNRRRGRGRGRGRGRSRGRGRRGQLSASSSASGGERTGQDGDIQKVCETRTTARGARPSGFACKADPAVRDLFARGQQLYIDGDFDEALVALKEVVRAQPGLPEPLHCIAQIHKHRGEIRRCLECTFIAAIWTSGPAARALWREVGKMSLEVGLAERALYAFKRSINLREIDEDDHDALLELSQLYRQRGCFLQEVRVLRKLYTSTRDAMIAYEVGRGLKDLKRWRDATDFLDDCLSHSWNAIPRRVPVALLELEADILFETRCFSRCAERLISFLQLGSIDRADLDSKLRSLPQELVAKLAAALCHLRSQGLDEGKERIQEAALQCVIANTDEKMPKHFLLLIDSLLDIDGGDNNSGIYRSWPALDDPGVVESARQASKILDRLESFDTGEDLRERRAMCLWCDGRSADAAGVLEEVLALPGSRTENECKALCVRTAEAWIAAGCSENAYVCLDSLSFDELQRADLLPGALSKDARRRIKMELEAFLDAAELRVELPPQHELRLFARRFIQLLSDIELDYARVTRMHRTEAGHPGTDAQDEEGPPECTEANASMSASAAAACDSDVAAPAAAQTPSEVVCVHVPRGKRQRSESQSIIVRYKRQHLGVESVEDAFGFEAYMSLVTRGCELLRRASRAGAESSARQEVHQDLTRAVELCNAILMNRRLVSHRNPVKRKLFSDLTSKSLSVAYEARMWRMAFKHLRTLCDQTDSVDAPFGLLARLLFSHKETNLFFADSEGTQWEKFRAHTTTSLRHTYAASVTDVRAWALRKLQHNQQSFDVTLLCAHFCTAAATYPQAVAMYSRAHRLRPEHELTCLCLGISYLSFAMSRTAVNRHDLVLKGLAFLQKYRRLRRGSPLAEAAETEPNVADDTDAAAKLAEVSYNFGRAFHQLEILHLAAQSYRDCLTQTRALAHIAERRCDVAAIQSACAYNLAQVYTALGDQDTARQVLHENIVF